MSSETETPVIEKTDVQVMKEQEAQLRNKYPGIKPGGSSLLQKRMSKGAQKYFDSGDYNMAKARGSGGGPKASGLFAKPSVPITAQKASIEIAVESGAVITGDEIPTPETVASRKQSVHLQSKLATGSSPS